MQNHGPTGITVWVYPNLIICPKFQCGLVLDAESSSAWQIMLSKHPLRAGLEFMLVFGSQVELVKANKWVRVKPGITFLSDSAY